jgi:hypothetical protein
MKVKQTWEIDKKDARFRELDDEAILALVADSMSLGMIYLFDEESSETMLKGPVCRLVTTKIEIVK